MHFIRPVIDSEGPCLGQRIRKWCVIGQTSRAKDLHAALGNVVIGPRHGDLDDADILAGKFVAFPVQPPCRALHQQPCLFQFDA